MGDRCWIGGWIDVASLHKVWKDKKKVDAIGEMLSLFWYEIGINDFMRHLPQEGRIWMEDDEVNYAGIDEMKTMAAAGIRFAIKNASGGDYPAGTSVGDGEGNFLEYDDANYDASVMKHFAKACIAMKKKRSEVDAYFDETFPEGKATEIEGEIEELTEINGSSDGSYKRDE